MLGDLTNLTQLDLLRNDLDGSIPSSLGDLTNLTRLHLAENDFSGSIPSSLGNLTSLESLYLFRNELEGPDTDGVGQPDQPELAVHRGERVHRVHTGGTAEREVPRPRQSRTGRLCPRVDGWRCDEGRLDRAQAE